ncbi:fatty acid-binding protein, brain-like [Salminus brasiliensis]|uniref:fatty acid-binding protein, brain-like n=1 Tax=Salminus brasiliensis TaxID=930266 RepID=UPI003B835900
MEAFFGSWKFVKSENFTEYLIALGMAHETIKVWNSLKPTLNFSKEGVDVVLKMEANDHTREISFKLDQEFDETIGDGKNAKSVVYLEGDKLVHIQKWDDKQSTVIREVNGKQMVTTLEAEDIVAVCTYERA